MNTHPAWHKTYDTQERPSSLRGGDLPSATGHRLSNITATEATMCEEAPEVFRELVTLLTELQNVGTALAAAVAGVMLVYAGYLWMTGIDGKEQARRIVVNVIIGMSIVVLASGIVEWIETILC